MPIPFKRFKFLDNETNIAVAEFNKITDSDIFNSVNNEFKKASAELENFIKTPDVKTLIKNIESDIDRISKGISAPIKDISKLSTKDVDKLLVDLFPKDAVSRSMVSQLSDKCKNNTLGSNGMGKPFDPTVKCGTKNNKTTSTDCKAYALSNIINKITGGAYGDTFKDLNNVLKLLVALSKYGFDLNMCGVFSALANTIDDKNVLSRGIGTLLGYASGTKNLLASIELANKSVGLFPLLENPKAISSVFKTASIPNSYKEHTITELSDKLSEGMTLLDSKWDKSKLDNIPSIVNIEGYTKDLDKILTSKRVDKIFDSTKLNIIPDIDSDFMSLAYSMKKEASKGIRI